MQLHGIATALYGTEENSIVSVTTLTSESADQIFIEKTQKAEIDPLNTQEVHDAFGLVLDEISRQHPQIHQMGDRSVQIPTALIYGTPEEHLATTYRSMIPSGFPEYFSKITAENDHVTKLLEHLFLMHHLKHGQKGSIIECKPFHLYLPKEEKPKPGTCTEEDVNAELDRLHQAAEKGDAKALAVLRGYAKDTARQYLEELRIRGIEMPRFVQYGPRNGAQGTSRYTALQWYNLRDIFVGELTRYMQVPHNVCVKTPDDPPAPPFADICATQLADYWDILEGRSNKRHVFARQPTA